MKRLSFALLSIVALGLLAFPAIAASAPSTGGRLVINRSPLLGRNVSITLKIDGKLAATIGWQRNYDGYLTPGRHVITAIPSRRGTPWQETLEVRANETYTYTASYAVDKLKLERTQSSR